MPKLQNLLNTKTLTRLIIVTAVYLLLLLVPSIMNSFHESYLNVLQKTRGQISPDTNVVIITIDNEDIESLGGWPLKRSYYALLINQLSEYHPKVFGLEVYLSVKNSAQNIYTDLLLKELHASKNVVLSSLLWNLDKMNGEYYTDTIFYSQLRRVDTSLVTGHLNYLDLSGYQIPMIVHKDDEAELSFSAAIAKVGGVNEFEQGLMRVNIHSSWQQFKKIGLLEFFNMHDAGDPALRKLKDKFILLGVVDPSIARGLNSPFDSYLPGIGFHALALSNILQQNFIIDKYYELSTYLFLVFILLIAVYTPKVRAQFYYPVVLFVFLLLSFITYSFYNLDLNWLVVIIPVFLLFVYKIARQYVEREELLEQSISERDVLEQALRAKENKLKELENELAVESKEGGDNLLEKVTALKHQIEQLKEFQKDDETEEITGLTEPVNFHGMFFVSNLMRKLTAMIEKVAPQNATVLITGESGSGKELVANSIHKLSKRSQNNFVAVNCAALTDSLLESELFGHTKGAFTNAVNDKKGLFESANNGTIFLDEIGETSENFQVKLLRVLQSGEIQKVGSTETIKVDARVIAATNRNLVDLVREKKFREDLFYRLNVITLHVPPLRERKEDIIVIANHFAENEKPGLKISKAVMDQLENNEWKGNVRELESVIKRASIFALSENRDIIQMRDIPDEFRTQSKSDIETLILDSLREKEFSHSSINETAEELGDLSRTVISENFRGIFFKNFVSSNFDLDSASKNVSGSSDEDVVSKVKSKGETYLRNVQRDIEKLRIDDFDQIKSKFASKYKNLPQRYHTYLDSVIKHFLV